MDFSACFLAIFTYGQNDNSPKYSNEFLNIGVGARSLGMSNSVITSSSDVMAGYLNPANLTRIDSDLQIGLMHAEYFAALLNMILEVLPWPLMRKVHLFFFFKIWR